MQFVRTLLLVLILTAILFFVGTNWGPPVEVRFWPGTHGDNFLFEWPVGFIALVFFLLGAIPTYLIYRGMKWRFKRRIASLEAANARITQNALDRDKKPRDLAPPVEPIP